MDIWHIQMHMPQGRDGTVINSLEMLKELQPVIGTGEWDDFQCRNFKNEKGHGLKLNDIVLVRIGKRPIALCRLIDNKYFTDKVLTLKYLNTNFRKVEVLTFFEDSDSDFPQSQGTLQHLKDKHSTSYEYIDEKYKNYQKKIEMKQIIDVLIKKKQIILQGPPGSGKTYTAKDIAELMIFNDTKEKENQKNRLEKSDQFKLIQFHPAYSYEDFVRGISVKNIGNQIEYKTENKLLAKFAIEANENYLNSKKPIAEYSEEKWFEKNFSIFCDKVQETIDEKGKFELTDNVSIVEIDEDAFRYKGNTWEIQRPHRMRFNDIKVSFLDNLQTRQEVKFSPSVSLSAHQHASYYFKMLQEFRSSITEIKPTVIPTKNTIELKNYVLIIDEINRANLPAVLGELIYALEYRGETVKSMYDIDGNNSLIIPPNLYIIGTMNTSDRSVGHIDYAIRRRFAFVDILPKVLEIDNFQVDYFRNVSELFISNFDEYIKNSEIALEKSEYLSDEFRPEDVWLGHSYFISSDADFNIRKKYEIIPILKEYIKDGILKQSAEEIINNL